MLGLTLTTHAAQRSRHRGIQPAAIAAALDFGTHRSIRGVDVYTLGWRDIDRCALSGLDLSRYQSIEVVCAHSGAIP